MKKLLCVFLLICLPATAYGLPLFDIECAIGGRNISPDNSDGFLLGGTTGDSDYDNEWDATGRLKVGMPLIIPNVYGVASPMAFQSSVYDRKLTLNQYDVGLYYSIPFLNTLSLKMLNVEVGLNARFIDAEKKQSVEAFIDAKFMDSEADVLTYAQEDFILPMLYLGCQFTPVDRFALEVEFWGTTYDDQDVYTMIGRLKVKVLGPLFIAGGYRYDDINIEEGTLKVDGTFSGVFTELGVKF